MATNFFTASPPSLLFPSTVAHRRLRCSSSPLLLIATIPLNRLPHFLLLFLYLKLMLSGGEGDGGRLATVAWLWQRVGVAVVQDESLATGEVMTAPTRCGGADMVVVGDSWWLMAVVYRFAGKGWRKNFPVITTCFSKHVTCLITFLTF
ncbi:unnamed protein product [Cuscuta epithymum]|uniref:Uncharacterized protein n=1 Tax=Cuscuta epithymum TaxID=186058 RepID=A0AAV0DEW4_9ASTE|nr:unnamed protein product [Cuscuta epithymum]